MMSDSLEKSEMYVEGKDDLHSLVNLLKLHGFDYDTKPWPSTYPRIVESETVEKLIKQVSTAVKLSTGRAVGFVLDADVSLANRWQAIHAQLAGVGVLDLPTTAPAHGFVGVSSLYESRVGVWLMPDNQRDGMLEDFLHTLIGGNDILIRLAETATDDALEQGARFSPNHRSKAVLHTWLAWQERPGLTYGLALKARYFLHDASVAQAFTDWFRRLYGLDSPEAPAAVR